MEAYTWLEGTNPAQRRVAKCPLPIVETVSLVDERRGVARLLGPAPINCLPSIGVAGPFVKSECASEIPDVADAPKKAFRQVIQHLAFVRINDIARTELQSWLARDSLSTELDGQLGCMSNEPFINFNYFCDRHWQSDLQTQSCCQQVIGQNSDVLRIILELDNVEVAVLNAHQVTLRTPAHSANVLDRNQRHSSRLHPLVPNGFKPDSYSRNRNPVQPARSVKIC